MYLLAACIINVWGYTEILPVVHLEKDTTHFKTMGTMCNVRA